MGTELKFCLISYKRQNILSDWPPLCFMSILASAYKGEQKALADDVLSGLLGL
jgi:hypothetical protein